MSRSTGGLTAPRSPTRSVGVDPGEGADEPFHRGPNGPRSPEQKMCRTVLIAGCIHVYKDSDVESEN